MNINGLEVKKTIDLIPLFEDLINQYNNSVLIRSLVIFGIPFYGTVYDLYFSSFAP
jgi:hypothetical protein